jgi:hypothetical protein
VRIGVYIDGFNLYYGARGLCGRGTPGWRWIDLRGLATDLVGRRTNWAGAQVERVVYCTARIGFSCCGRLCLRPEAAWSSRERGRGIAEPA